MERPWWRGERCWRVPLLPLDIEAEVTIWRPWHRFGLGAGLSCDFEMGGYIHLSLGPLQVGVTVEDMRWAKSLHDEAEAEQSGEPVAMLPARTATTE